MIKKTPSEITIVFHSAKEEDEKVKNYVETLGGFKIIELDLKREDLTEDQLGAIVEMLEVDVEDLFDHNYADRFKVKSLRQALKILINDPKLLATPILIIGPHAYQFEFAYDILRDRKETKT